VQRSLIVKVGGTVVAAGVIGAGIGFAISDSSPGTDNAAVAAANASPAQTTTSTSTSTTVAPGPLVTTKRNAAFGTLLADGRGMTLYTLTANGQALPCTGQCPALWPPLYASTGWSASAASVSGLGTTIGPNGAPQVTYHGLPLYRFSKDSSPSDANGEGIAAFGGVWHVARLATTSTAAAVTPSSPTPQPRPRATTAPQMGWPARQNVQTRQGWSY